MTTAEQLRETGTQLALMKAGEWERQVIENTVRAIGEQRGEVTSADIQPLLPRLASPNAIGGLLLGLARRGVLVDTGRTAKARHPAGRCRRVVVWRYVGGAA